MLTDQSTDPRQKGDSAQAAARTELELAAHIAGIVVPEIVVPTSRQVIVGDMRLHFLDWAFEQNRPIVFLHGGGLNAHTWDLVCLAMRDRFHCVALDQRGHGESEWSPVVDYTPEAHTRDIEGFCDALGFDRFILVGQSLGAMNALLYASRFPDRVEALVLVDYTPDVQASGGGRIHQFVGETASATTLDELIEKAVAFNPLRDRRLLRRSLLHNFRQLPDGSWVRKTDLRGHERARHRLLETAQRQWELVPSVRCPSLVVRGGLSDVISSDQAARLASTLPDGRWALVERAGHNVQGDNPNGLVIAVDDFLASQGLGERRRAR